jgi:tRNA (mo5U34)-methyltransferase
MRVLLNIFRRKAAPAAPADPEEYRRVRRLADSVPSWWHSIDLGQGVVTPGSKTAEVLRREVEAHRYPDLRGKDVLDVGAWDGYFSFDAERRGAARVVALDHYVWALDAQARDHYWRACRQAGVTPKDCHLVPQLWRYDALPGKRGFDAAREALRSKVEAVVGDFQTMDLAGLGAFDVVFFFGVLYHVRHPLAALERVAELTRELAIIETSAVIVPGYGDVPLCEFFEDDGLSGDRTNWWAPNVKGLEALCRAAGFRRVEVVSRPPRTWALRKREVARCRITAHAWK